MAVHHRENDLAHGGIRIDRAASAFSQFGCACNYRRPSSATTTSKRSAGYSSAAIARRQGFSPAERLRVATTIEKRRILAHHVQETAEGRHMPGNLAPQRLVFVIHCQKAHSAKGHKGGKRQRLRHVLRSPELLDVSCEPNKLVARPLCAV